MAQQNLCPSNKQHGPMTLRPDRDMTPEQRYCGTWYDCQHCHTSVLIPSPELKADLEAQRHPTRQAVLPV